MEEKLVSIISPCFNGEAFLKRFFNNILEQTYDNIELIFVNDGSTDNTEKIAMSFKKAIEEKKYSFVYIYQENAGQAAAVNQGIKIFKGDYLMWTDSDDILHKDNVKHKVEFMERNTQFGFAQCIGKEALESDMNTKIRDFRRIPPIGKDHFFDDLLMKNNVEYTPGLYIARRSAFLKAHPNRDIYESRRGQNIQLLLPLAYHFECGYLNEDLFTYVIREESHSHDRITTDEFVKRSYEIKTLLLETIKRIEMADKTYYEKKIDEKIIRDLFDGGYAFNDKNLLETNYRKLSEKKYRTKRDMMVYYAFKFKIIKWIFMALKKLKAFIKHLVGWLKTGVA
jgi:glycosyltransferase involved in cell wall biosynthesis